MLFWGHVSGDCGSFSDSFYVYSPEVSWHNLCVNEYREKTDNRESLSKKCLALCINPMLLATLFPNILNVPSIKDFHQTKPLEVLYKMLFLFPDY